MNVRKAAIGFEVTAALSEAIKVLIERDETTGASIDRVDGIPTVIIFNRSDEGDWPM